MFSGGIESKHWSEMSVVGGSISVMKHVTFLYPLKTHQKTARLSDVFRGYRNVT